MGLGSSASPKNGQRAANMANFFFLGLWAAHTTHHTHRPHRRIQQQEQAALVPVAREAAAPFDSSTRRSSRAPPARITPSFLLRTTTHPNRPMSTPQPIPTTTAAATTMGRLTDKGPPTEAELARQLKIKVGVAKRYVRFSSTGVGGGGCPVRASCMRASHTLGCPRP